MPRLARAIGCASLDGKSRANMHPDIDPSYMPVTINMRLSVLRALERLRHRAGHGIDAHDLVITLRHYLEALPSIVDAAEQGEYLALVTAEAIRSGAATPIPNIGSWPPVSSTTRDAGSENPE